MDHPFRSAAFGGFNRQDVLDYLEKTAAENARKQQELQRRLEEAEEDREAAEITQEQFMERMELERLLQEALAQLTPAQRRRVLAHFVEGRSQLEIAASEGVVKSTVSEAISRGRKNLRNFLKKFR